MRISLLALGLAIMLPTFSLGDTILFEDFEDATILYTTSNGEFNDGNEDYFSRLSLADISTDVQFSNIQGNSFFGAQDIDDGNSRPTNQTVTFENIDITNFTNLAFSAFFAEDQNGASENWDFNDFVLFEYRLNDGAFQNLIAVESNDPSNAGFNFAPRLDTNFDGIGDGTEITDTFTEFGAMITGTGNDLDVRITISLNAGEEDFAFDNFTITGDLVGVPEPTSFALLGVLGVALCFHRKRRQK